MLRSDLLLRLRPRLGLGGKDPRGFLPSNAPEKRLQSSRLLWPDSRLLLPVSRLLLSVYRLFLPVSRATTELRWGTQSQLQKRLCKKKRFEVKSVLQIELHPSPGRERRGRRSQSLDCIRRCSEHRAFVMMVSNIIYANNWICQKNNKHLHSSLLINRFGSKNSTKVILVKADLFFVVVRPQEPHNTPARMHRVYVWVANTTRVCVHQRTCICMLNSDCCGTHEPE